jgi:hypothetical protein
MGTARWKGDAGNLYAWPVQKLLIWLYPGIFSVDGFHRNNSYSQHSRILGVGGWLKSRFLRAICGNRRWY